MLCENANALLVEYAAEELPPNQRLDVDQHLASCDTCQSDLQAISQMQNMAAQWQEVATPPWTPPQIAFTKQSATQKIWANNPLQETSQPFWDNFRMWFPTLASSAALVLVAVIFIQQPASVNGIDRQTNPSGLASTPANFAEQSSIPASAQTMLVKQVMENSQAERAEEIQSILNILKAELDARERATEESLRYIITHQVRGQQELEALYQQVEDLAQQEQGLRNQTTKKQTGQSGASI